MRFEVLQEWLPETRIRLHGNDASVATDCSTRERGVRASTRSNVEKTPPIECGSGKIRNQVVTSTPQDEPPGCVVPWRQTQRDAKCRWEPGFLRDDLPPNSAFALGGKPYPPKYDRNGNTKSGPEGVFNHGVCVRPFFDPETVRGDAGKPPGRNSVPAGQIANKPASTPKNSSSCLLNPRQESNYLLIPPLSVNKCQYLTIKDFI